MALQSSPMTAELPAKAELETSPTLLAEEPALAEEFEGWSAWTEVLGSFFLIFNTSGLVNAFGAFQDYYLRELLSSHSSSQIAWIGTLEASLCFEVALISGVAYDLGYFRLLLYGGTFFMVFGMMMLSISHEFYQVILTHGFCCGFGGGLLWVPSMALVASTFNDKQRPLAMGFASSGAAVGGVIYPIVFRQLLPKIGFGWTTRVMGLIVLATCITSFLVIRKPRTSTMGVRTLIQPKAFLEPPYLVFVIGALLQWLGYFVPSFFIPTFGRVVIGTSPSLTVYLVSIMNAGSFFGRIVPSIIAQYTSPISVLTLSGITAGILFFTWFSVDTVAGFVVFALVWGVLNGVIVTLQGAAVALLSPSKDVVGTRIGMMSAIGAIGILVGSPIGGALTDLPNKDFSGTQAWSGSMMMAGSLLLIYPWYMSRREKPVAKQANEAAETATST